MIVSIGFLIAMVLAGGLVALMADKLGRTLGKKRLTLFGMRPRHTATTMTVAAGMLIPLITVAVVAAASKETRVWFFEGADALRQRDEARREVLVYQQEIDRIKPEVEKRRNELASLTAQYQQTSSELKKLRASFARLTTAMNESQAANRRYQGQLKERQAQLVAAEKRLDTIETTLDNTALLLASRTEDLSNTATRLATLRTSYDSVYKQREEANDAVGRLSGERDQLTALNTSLRDANAKASADLQKTNEDLKAATQDLQKVQADLRVAEQTLVYTKGLYASNLERTRFAPQIFAIGDELARISVPAGTNAHTAKGLYAQLMRQANAVATARGAKASGDQLAANLISRPDEKGNNVSPEEQEAALIGLMTNSDKNVVVIASSLLNVFNEEWVPLAVRVFGNPTVYKQNDRIAEITINGTEPETAIIQHISDFLTRTVKPQALKDNMIPVAGNEESFGEYPLAGIIDLAKEIRGKARPIRLVALADFDTRAGDPLRLHLRVR